MKQDTKSQGDTIKVFYAGSLPKFGSVGTHPQFSHLASPPSGYEFVDSGVLKSGNLPHLAASSLKFFGYALTKGAKPEDIISFIKTRGLRTQLQVPLDVQLAFLPTWPYIVNQVPWVVEIEDATTLFAPLMAVGGTRNMENFDDCPLYKTVKALIESDDCRGIISHVKSTADGIPVLFKNEALRQKVTHIPLGVKLPDLLVPSHSKDEMINILFTNSWHQGTDNFYLRGGLDLLEAFSILCKKYSNIRLIIRSRIPSDLNEYYNNLIINNWRIKVIDQFIPNSCMQNILAETSIYVLPSARLHVVAILQAMANAIPVIVSDGWGIEEYVEDGWNGIVVKGRYGKSSWMDEQKGIIRENHQSLFSGDPVVVNNLVEALSRLIENSDIRKQLGQNARKDVEMKFSLTNWNEGLKKAFDRAIIQR